MVPRKKNEQVFIAVYILSELHVIIGLRRRNELSGRTQGKKNHWKKISKKKKWGMLK